MYINPNPFMSDPAGNKLDKRILDREKHLTPRITEPQCKFLENLLTDCGFGTRVQRNAYLTRECKREVRFLDEISREEAKTLIGQLLDQRDRGRTSEPGSLDEEI